MALNNVMLVEFDQDEVIYPRDSEVFGEVTKKDKNGIRVDVPMEKTEIYKNDWLGLKYLKEHNKIKIVHINAKHIVYDVKNIENTFLPFLKL